MARGYKNLNSIKGKYKGRLKQVFVVIKQSQMKQIINRRSLSYSISWTAVPFFDSHSNNRHVTSPLNPTRPNLLRWHRFQRPGGLVGALKMEAPNAELCTIVTPSQKAIYAERKGSRASCPAISFCFCCFFNHTQFNLVIR